LIFAIISEYSQAFVLAIFGVETTCRISQPLTTLSRPIIKTGSQGIAFSTPRFSKFFIVLIFQNESLQTILSHLLIVQVLTKTVATGQSFVSKCDSRTVATQALSGFALSSFISATRSKISSKSSIPNHDFAETGIIGVSPHQSSGVKPFSANCHLT